MLKVILVSLLFLINQAVSAQVDLDSAWNRWEDISRTDDERIQSMRDFIYDGYFYSQPDSTLFYANQLYEFTESVENKEGMVDALNMIGYTFFRVGNTSKALETYQKALDLSKQINYEIGTAEILLRTGFVFHDNGDLVRALRHYQDSEAIFAKINDLDGLASVYNEFGSVYRVNDEFDKSLEYYMKAIDINDKLDQYGGNAAIFNNLGDLYFDEDDFTTALDYYQKAYDLSLEENDKIGIASGLAGIGTIYSETGNPSKAIEHLERSIEISREINDQQGIAHSLLDLSATYFDQRQFAKSVKSCKESLAIAGALGDIGVQQESYDCLYAVYKEMGNIGNALMYLELNLEFADSLNSQESSKLLQQMEFSKKIVTDSLAQLEKDLKVELAYQDEIRKKDRNRNLAIGSSLFFLLLSGGFYSRWQYVNNSRAIIKKEKDRSESLLLNILPAEIAKELKEKGSADARDFEVVSILFTDFKGYTEKSKRLSAKELVIEINECFMAFDHICEKYNIEKIKTIGDAYMAVGGLPIPSEDSIQNTVLAALEMQSFITKRVIQKKSKNEIPFDMRLGIHTGSVVAGIVGVKKFQYDIWGDTVNIASRMESGGKVGRVNISNHTYELLKDNPIFKFESRGKIKVKGDKEMEMWFVDKK